MRAIVVSDGTTTVRSPEDRESLAAVRDTPGLSWVDATGADPDALGELVDVFDIHPLSAEDVRSDLRAKVETFESYTFALLSEPGFGPDAGALVEQIEARTVGLFVGEDWLVTYAVEPIGAVDQVWSAAADSPGQFTDRGPDFTAYRVARRLMEEYYQVIDDVEDNIEAIEDAVVEDPSPETLATINEVRADLLALRKLLWPARDAVAALAWDEGTYVREANRKYFRSTYDQLVELVELIETYRELASGSRDIYLNALSTSTNEVMKRLTVVATIILPLTFVAGIYGMNFEGSPYNMPELGWTYAYPAVMLGMLGVTAVMLAYFRQEGWL